jgi:hypothetical protein
VEETQDEEKIARVVTEHLDARFPSMAREQVEAVAHRRVHDRYVHARIKNFVGIIAERDARAELARLGS